MDKWYNQGRFLVWLTGGGDMHPLGLPESDFGYPALHCLYNTYPGLDWKNMKCMKLSPMLKVQWKLRLEDKCFSAFLTFCTVN